MSVSKIKKLFALLSKEEQADLIKELYPNFGISISIVDFCVNHQKQYGTSVRFSISKTGFDHAPLVTAVAHTAFGDFEGKGPNQKVAKANAVENASGHPWNSYL